MATTRSIGTRVFGRALVALLLAAADPVHADDTAGASGAPAAGQDEAPVSVAPQEDTTSECLALHELAQEQRLERRLIDARATLRACSRPDCPSMIRIDCVTWLDEVENSISSIVLAARSDRGDETRVRVLIDGQLAAQRLDGRAVEMDPGAHDVRFELSPYPTVTRSIVVREGERNRVIAARFTMPPQPQPLPPPPEPPGPPTTAFVLGGVAVMGIATGLGAGGSALALRNNRQDSCAPLCDEEDESTLRTRAIVADVGWAVGVLAAGGAALIWVRYTKQRDATTAIHGGIGVGRVGAGAGVWLKGGLR